MAVSEELGRKAIDNVLKGVTTEQKSCGIEPSPSKAEAVIRPIVEKTIKEQEERTALGRFADPTNGAQPGESKARLDRGEVGEGAVAINRGVNWKARAKKQKPANAEDARLRERLALLSAFPEWKNRLMQAAHDGELAAMRSGSPEDRTNWNRRKSIIADHVLKVVEQSNNVFGDYLNPRALPSGPIFSFGVKKP